MTSDDVAPVTAGEVLRQMCEAMGLTQVELAKRSGHSAKHINHVMSGASSLTVPLAVDLEKVLGQRGIAEHLLAVQTKHDLWMRRRLT